MMSMYHEGDFTHEACVYLTIIDYLCSFARNARGLFSKHTCCIPGGNRGLTLLPRKAWKPGCWSVRNICKASIPALQRLCLITCKAEMLAFYRATAKHTHGLAIDNCRPSVRLSNACIVTKRKHLAKKSSVMTNRKSSTSFPMNLRWTAYVAPNPQRGPQKRFFSIFGI